MLSAFLLRGKEMVADLVKDSAGNMKVICVVCAFAGCRGIKLRSQNLKLKGGMQK